MFVFDPDARQATVEKPNQPIDTRLLRGNDAFEMRMPNDGRRFLKF